MKLKRLGEPITWPRTDSFSGPHLKADTGQTVDVRDEIAAIWLEREPHAWERVTDEAPEAKGAKGN